MPGLRCSSRLSPPACDVAPACPPLCAGTRSWARSRRRERRKRRPALSLPWQSKPACGACWRRSRLRGCAGRLPSFGSCRHSGTAWRASETIWLASWRPRCSGRSGPKARWRRCRWADMGQVWGRLVGGGRVCHPASPGFEPACSAPLRSPSACRPSWPAWLRSWRRPSCSCARRRPPPPRRSPPPARLRRLRRRSQSPPSWRRRTAGRLPRFSTRLMCCGSSAPRASRRRRHWSRRSVGWCGGRPA